MRRVVVAGIGFVNPLGIGSSGADLRLSPPPALHELGGGKRLHYYPLPDITTSPQYPDRKMLRCMRPDAIYAFIAASLAMENAGLIEADHVSTSLYAGAGQSYADMWPFIREGIEASYVDGAFNLDRFGREGFLRINPFFAVRSLAALPLALIAQKYQIRGENSVLSSFGAESVEAIAHACADIRCGAATVALAGGFDYLLSLPKVENLFCNDFYEGDLYAASSACFLVLEEQDHNRKRNGNCLGEIVETCTQSRPVGAGMAIDYRSTMYCGLCPEHLEKRVHYVSVNPSGTLSNHEEEVLAARARFPGCLCESYFDRMGTLLGGAEPFGTALTLMSLTEGLGLSLSRSLNGTESAVLVSREVENA